MSTSDNTTSLRSKNVKRNIIFSIILKAVGVGLSFIILPLTIHYLTEVEYGLWVTLFSVMNWVNIMDMGIGLGLRNKLAEAVSKNDVTHARMYISTGFFSLVSIGSILLAIFYITLQFVDMQAVFNTDELSTKTLYDVTLLTGSFVIVAFVLSIIQQFYYAYQKAAVTGMISIMHSIVLLAIVYALTLQSTHKLIYFVYAFGTALLSSRIVFTLIFFSKRHSLIPRLSYVKLKAIKEITDLGLRFFIIQLCCIFGYTFCNFLITELLGPEYVRSFDVISKIMGAALMLQQLVTNPLWSAYTDAYVRKDYSWIFNAFKKSIWLTSIISIVFLVVAIFIDDIIWIWMHMHLDYSMSLVLLILIYYVLILYNNAFCMVLNGIGNLNIQMIAWIITAILVIPLSCYFVKIQNMGVEGIALGMCLSMSVLIVTLPLQLIYLFRKWRKEIIL